MKRDRTTILLNLMYNGSLVNGEHVKKMSDSIVNTPVKAISSIKTTNNELLIGKRWTRPNQFQQRDQ